MRTTLDLDEDVLQAAKELAEARNTTAGKVLSELARKGLGAGAHCRTHSQWRAPLAPHRPVGPIPTMKLVNELRDDD